MSLKKIGKALLFPHIAVLVLSLLLSLALLVVVLVYVDTSDSPIAIASYAVFAYTFTVLCARVPAIIKKFRALRSENKYVKAWFESHSLRVKVSLYSSVLSNAVFAAFQFCLGLYHGSFWFYSLTGYYFSLALIRLFLLVYTRSHAPGENYRKELTLYRMCGWFFLSLNMFLSVMIIFMIRFDRTFTHHEITTIAIAAYTFTSLTLSIIGIVRYRKYNSPVYSASKAVSLCSASVSMITLETTMLTTFGGAEIATTRRILLASSGGAVAVFLILMAIYMIVTSTRKIKSENKGTINGTE